MKNSMYRLLLVFAWGGFYSVMAVNQLLAERPTPSLVLPLWEQSSTSGIAPGSEGFQEEEIYEQRGTKELSNRWLTGTSKPSITIYHPRAGRSQKAAMLIFPGGGYGGLAIDKEGHRVANWLAQQGMLAGVVTYRCGGGMHQHPVPLSDAQQAIRLVRQRAKELGVNPNKVGVMGFSAGGHLAATTATHGDSEVRPNFAALIYPVISLRSEYYHRGSCLNLLGEAPTDAEINHLSNDEQVDGKTPPTFLVHSTDDKSVPVENSLRFYEACRENQVQAEMHIYPTGGHGYGMHLGPEWAPLLEAWLISNNWIAKAN